MGANPLTSGDITWALRSLLERVALSMVPIGLHIRYAAMRGVVHRRTRGVSEAVKKNLMVINEHFSVEDVHLTAKRYAECSQWTRLRDCLPLHYGLKKSKRWRVIGEEHLEPALRGGRGVFLVTAHFGLARLIGPLLRCRGFDVVRLVAVPLENIERRQRWREWIQARKVVGRWIESLLGELLKPHDISAGLDVRPILTALADNKCIMVAGDGLVGTDFIEMPFFGQRYPFPAGIVKLALTTGASVVPTFAFMGSAREIIVEMHPAISLDKQDSLENNLAKLVAVLEQCISRSLHLYTRLVIPHFFKKASAWAALPPEVREAQMFGSWATTASSRVPMLNDAEKAEQIA